MSAVRKGRLNSAKSGPTRWAVPHGCLCPVVFPCFPGPGPNCVNRWGGSRRHTGFCQHPGACAQRAELGLFAGIAVPSAGCCPAWEWECQVVEGFPRLGEYPWLTRVGKNAGTIPWRPMGPELGAPGNGSVWTRRILGPGGIPGFEILGRFFPGSATKGGPPGPLKFGGHLHPGLPHCRWAPRCCLHIWY